MTLTRKSFEVKEKKNIGQLICTKWYDRDYRTLFKDMKSAKNAFIVLPRYYDHVYIFVFLNIEIKTLELFTCNAWLHTIRL